MGDSIHKDQKRLNLTSEGEEEGKIDWVSSGLLKKSGMYSLTMLNSLPFQQIQHHH